MRNNGETTAKEEYDILLDNGDLFNLFPSFKGIWEKDKKEFSRFHEMNEEILKISRDFDVEEGFEGVYED